MISHDQLWKDLLKSFFSDPKVSGIQAVVYREELFGKVINEFNYLVICLPNLNGSEYLHKNILSAAIAALMQPGKFGKAKLKAEALL